MKAPKTAWDLMEDLDMTVSSLGMSVQLLIGRNPMRTRSLDHAPILNLVVNVHLQIGKNPESIKGQPHVQFLHVALNLPSRTDGKDASK